MILDMAHNCVDWTARSPTRKTPLLILTRGDDHVYTVVPTELKTLEDIARKEFDLGDVDVRFSSSCVNFCHGQPARITESAWEYISPYIGCATVEVSDPRTVEVRLRQGQPTASEMTEDERDSSAKRQLPPDADEGHENEQLDGMLGTLTGETVRDEQDTTSDHGNDRNGASAPEEDQHEEPWEEEEEEVSAILPQRTRFQRRVVSEDDKKERHGDSQSAEPLHRPSKPINQEKRESGNGIRPQLLYTESEYEIHTQTQTQVESGENDKLMIRVAHRPSKQESKFTAKGTTRVAKVLAGACKSFGLDASRATLYLIVSMEDEDGQVESLFPCDKRDTIARAGAERDTEARFLLKMAGEV